MLSSFSASPAPVLSDPRSPLDSVPVGGEEAQASAQLLTISASPNAAPFADVLAAADMPAVTTCDLGPVLPPSTPANATPAPECPPEALSIFGDSKGCPARSEAAPAGLAPAPARPSAARRPLAASAEAPRTEADASAVALVLAGSITAPVTVVGPEPEPVSLDLRALSAAPGADQEAAALFPVFVRAKDLYPNLRDDVTASVEGVPSEAGPAKPVQSEHAPASSPVHAPDARETGVVPFSSQASAATTAAATTDASSAVFAAPVSTSSPIASLVSPKDQKSSRQDVDSKEPVFGENVGGTEKAKGVSAMSPAPAQVPATVSALSRRAVEGVKFAGASMDSSASTSSASPLSASAFSPVAPAPSPVPAETVPASTPLPAAASSLVERVSEVAENVAARPSEQVKLSLDLDGSHRVEVKVAMRGGRVFADFRTDSPEMRVALAHAWEGFVRGREASTQRWADPVFSSLGASSAASPTEQVPASASASGSFDGQLSSRQEAGADERHASRRDPFAEEREGAPSGSFGSSSLRGSSAAVAPAATRTDSSRLLSALA